MGDILGGSVTLEIDDHWKFLRHILSPSFSPAKLKQVNFILCLRRKYERLKYVGVSNYNKYKSNLTNIIGYRNNN